MQFLFKAKKGSILALAMELVFCCVLYSEHIREKTEPQSIKLVYVRCKGKKISKIFLRNKKSVNYLDINL